MTKRKLDIENALHIYTILLVGILSAANSLTLQAKTVWADSVLDFSSRFSPTVFSEQEILGPPNTFPQGGDLATAWKPSFPDQHFQDIRVRFSEELDAAQIIVAESYNPGAISQIDLFDSDFKLLHTVSNPPGYVETSERIYSRILEPQVKGVKYARLVLATDMVLGYNAIDAIGISDDKRPYYPLIKLADVIFKHESENLGPNVNTKASDRFPVVSPDNKTLYFCRTGDTNNIGSYYLTDIYTSQLTEDGKATPAKNIGPPLNNGYSNFVTTAMPDGNTLVLGTSYIGDRSGPGISISRREEDGWSYPSNVMIMNLGPTGENSEYYMTSDGMHLLMSLDRRGTYGKNDIFISTRINDTLFSEPQNLGRGINTAEHESYPFLASDGKTLYFCSRGYPGYGESDIYMSRRIGESWQEWTEPVNLGPKINSRKFEGNISIPASGEYAYFVSSIYGYGMEDIFRIKLPEAYRPEPITFVSGIVTDQETAKPVGANIVYEDIYTGEELGRAVSNSITGQYSLSLPAGKRYSFSARAKNYYGIQENLDLTGLQNFDTVSRNLTLAPIKQDYAIRLNNIFFDSGEWELLPGSKTELRQLARYLKDKDYRIRIEGHTDDIGTDRDNLELSSKRAEAVYKFLVEEGIPERFLSSKGFGESKPLTSNNDDQGRALNRRVEFRVIKGLDTP